MLYRKWVITYIEDGEDSGYELRATIVGSDNKERTWLRQTYEMDEKELRQLKREVNAFL